VDAYDVELRGVTKRFDDVVAPMNNEPTARKMDTDLEDALGKGAEIVVGGSRDEGRPTEL